MSIERKFPKKTARTLAVLACAGALCLGGLSACISPDLEPPGATGTSIPTRPGGPMAAATDQTKTTGGTAAVTPTGANPSGNAAMTVPPTMMTAPSTTTPAVGAAGAGAGQSNGAAAPGGQPGASMAPPANTAGTSGAAGAASESTKDADAGVDTP